MLCINQIETDKKKIHFHDHLNDKCLPDRENSDDDYSDDDGEDGDDDRGDPPAESLQSEPQDPRAAMKEEARARGAAMLRSLGMGNEDLKRRLTPGATF